MDFTKRYRPRSFQEVIGQAQAVKILQGSLKSPPNLYLIHGPSGTGKTTLARIFARTINCRANHPNPARRSPCTPAELCVSCEAFFEDHHPDILEQNAANSNGIDGIRALIELTRSYPSNAYRVVILDEAHQLTGPAQECLLKPFEEPNATTVWFVITTNPEKIRTAIAGRAINVAVSSLSVQELESLLQRVATAEGINLPPEVSRAIAEYSDGMGRNALKRLMEFQLAGSIPDLSLYVKKLQATSPVVRAFSYIQGIMLKEPKRVFTATSMAENKVRFLEDVIEILRGLSYHAVGATELLDTHPHAARIRTVELQPWMSNAYVFAFNEHVQALEKMKTYVMSEQNALDSVAFKCLATRFQ